MVFSASLGISFGMLVLFGDNLEALAIVFLLVTASVVAANTSDLKELEKDKGLLGLIVLCTIFTTGVSYFAYQVFTSVFAVLVAINVLALASYFVMKRIPRYSDAENF